MSEYFTVPKSSRGSVKVELDLSHYAATVDLKNAAGVHTSDFAKKMKNIPSSLGSLKIKVDN